MSDYKLAPLWALIISWIATVALMVVMLKFFAYPAYDNVHNIIELKAVAPDFYSGLVKYLIVAMFASGILVSIFHCESLWEMFSGALAIGFPFIISIILAPIGLMIVGFALSIAVTFTVVLAPLFMIVDTILWIIKPIVLIFKR